MIYYRPTDGDPHDTPLRFRPRTCFLMTQMGGSIPPILSEIRAALKEVLEEAGLRGRVNNSVEKLLVNF